MTFVEAVAAAKRGEFVFWNGWNHGQCWTRFNPGPGPGDPNEGYSLEDVVTLVTASFRSADDMADIIREHRAASLTVGGAR